MTRLWIGLGLIAALAGGLLWYGQARYNDGVRDATAEFVAADKRGASEVHETARKVLNSLGSDDDVDRLLRETNGLRD